jgi:hypothetical protein
VRARLLELAALRKRFGYRRLGLLLRREGMVVNHKRVYRLYREEGLSLRRRKRKRLTSEGRGPGEPASGPDEVWSLDFMSDALAPGRRLKLLTVVDTFTRESLAIEVDTSISGERVARVLDRVIAERGAGPEEIVMDNGPEMTSRALDQWAYERGVRLRFIGPRQAGAELLHRELQRPVAGRVPQSALVSQPGRRRPDRRGVAAGLQSRPSPQRPWRAITRDVPSRYHGIRSRCGRPRPSLIIRGQVDGAGPADAVWNVGEADAGKRVAKVWPRRRDGIRQPGIASELLTSETSARLNA